jgi:ComF family protein
MRSSNFTRLLGTPCAVCSLAPGPLCAACEADFFPRQRARCPICAIALDVPRMRCGRCAASPPCFEGATALADYRPPVAGMVAALKFRAHLELATLFGVMLAERQPPAAGDLVIPVPLAFERLSERGFNQSLQIARAYGRRSGARVDADAVRRIRHAPPQQTLALDARRRNIRGAFAANRDLAGRTVLVVDDVMTSGSTMDELARVLLAAGAARVHALVVARTP